MNPLAEFIFATVRSQPGIHFRGLGRASDVSSAGQLRHHLDRLVRQGLVVEVKEGRFSRYFEANAHGTELRPYLARLARPVPRTIAKLLLTEPMTRTAIRRRIGCADSSLGYHLVRMLADNDVVRQSGRDGNAYALANPVLVQQALLELQNGPPVAG